MRLVAKAVFVLGMGITLGLTGCTVNWVLPAIPATAEATPEPEPEEEADSDAEETAAERAEREREAREARAREAEAREAAERQARATAEEERRDAAERAAVERAAEERAAREAAAREDVDEPAARAEAERQARAGGGDGDGPEEPREEDLSEEERESDEEREDEAEVEEDPAAGEPASEEEEEEPDAGDGPVSGPRHVEIPPGHYPRDGLCRIWYEGTPPGRQAPSAPCDRFLSVPLAPGAFVLYGGRAWDLEHHWPAVERDRPGSVPAPVLQLRRSYSETDHAVGGAPRETSVPPGQQPPDGLCRVWYDHLPPGRQAAPVECESLVRADLEEGAFLLYDGTAWDAEHDWSRTALEVPGSVPEVVLALFGG